MGRTGNSAYSALQAWLDCLRLSTRGSYEIILRVFCEWRGTEWGPKARIVDLKTPECYRYISSLKSRGLSEGTVKVHFACLRRAYRVLAECDVIHKNPWNGVLIRFTGEQVRPTEQIPDADVLKILDAPEGAYAARDKALLALLLGGGLRIGEACGLNANNFQKRSGVYCVWLARTKAGVSLWHSLPDWAGEAVQEVARQQTLRGIETPLLTGWGTNRISTHHARVIFHAACMKACGKRYSPHACRATGITKLLTKGVPIDRVQIFSRHKKIESVITYDKRSKGVLDNPGLRLDYTN
jgi:integrase